MTRKSVAINRQSLEPRVGGGFVKMRRVDASRRSWRKPRRGLRIWLAPSRKPSAMRRRFGVARRWRNLFGSKRPRPGIVVRRGLPKPPSTGLWRLSRCNPMVYYCPERRDPNFERKMREVLMVYQEVHLQNQRLVEGTSEPSSVIPVSIEEKPQAIATPCPDLSTVPGRHPALARDYQYRRLGTCSILAAIDLHTGHVTARVERRHCSRGFIKLLPDLDAYYPPDCTIRLILDSHSAHISKQTRACLATRPNRFKYIHTPAQGSWQNLVETLFGKMARTFLRHIRVRSWEELRDRMLQGIEEVNAASVVHRWNKFDALNTQ
jgi:DDE superfamily endonuclease